MFFQQQLHRQRLTRLFSDANPDMLFYKHAWNMTETALQGTFQQGKELRKYVTPKTLHYIRKGDTGKPILLKIKTFPLCVFTAVYLSHQSLALTVDLLFTESTFLSWQKQVFKNKLPSQFYPPTDKKFRAWYYNTFWAVSHLHSVLPVSLIRHGREWEACHTERTVYNQGEWGRLCLL